MVRTGRKQEGAIPFLTKPNKESPGQREMQFAESWPQHPKVGYTRMVKEMRDHKLITVAIIFELLQIQNY